MSGPRLTLRGTRPFQPESRPGTRDARNPGRTAAVAASGRAGYHLFMDQFVRLLMRMSLWVRRPPSRMQILIMAAVVALAAACFAIEAIWGWPSWLTANQAPRNLGFRPL
ncbi:hypothetical protein V5F53_00885 [Xanthobacter sp. V4C-4]|uniref:hypothetical protein n=1 Tax=Xanthobacter cornucopiae TaxID=3119924 RepID=UPI0037288577